MLAHVRMDRVLVDHVAGAAVQNAVGRLLLYGESWRLAYR